MAANAGVSDFGEALPADDAPSAALLRKPLGCPPPCYRIFLLRLWEDRAHGAQAAPVWRFSLEDARSKERYAFRDLTSMLAFLEAQTAPASGDSQTHSGAETYSGHPETDSGNPETDSGNPET